MSSVNRKIRSGSTFDWLAGISVLFLLRGLLYGLVITVFAAPALLIIPVVADSAQSFLYLVVAGCVLVPLSLPLNEKELEGVLVNLEELAERRESDVMEWLIYLMSLLVIAIFGLSLLVGTTALVATILATSAGVGELAILFAVLYPLVDSWVGRTTGYNIASVGGMIATGVMIGVSVAYSVSTDVPRDAASDLRPLIYST